MDLTPGVEQVLGNIEFLSIKGIVIEIDADADLCGGLGVGHRIVERDVLRLFDPRVGADRQRRLGGAEALHDVIIAVYKQPVSADVKCAGAGVVGGVVGVVDDEKAVAVDRQIRRIPGRLKRALENWVAMAATATPCPTAIEPELDKLWFNMLEK
jgi:hypothetical protein